MAWYTIDRILFCSVGIYLLMSSPRPLPARRVAVAMSLLGAAALLKQSFGPAAPLGVLTIVVLSFREGWRPCLGKSVMAGAVVLLPFAAYSGWVAAGGGFPDMIRELTSATPVWGEQFLNGSPLGTDGPGAVANAGACVPFVALGLIAGAWWHTTTDCPTSGGKIAAAPGIGRRGRHDCLTLPMSQLSLYGI